MGAEFREHHVAMRSFLGYFPCVRNVSKPVFLEVVSCRWGLGQMSVCIIENLTVLSGVIEIISNE